MIVLFSVFLFGAAPARAGAPPCADWQRTYFEIGRVEPSSGHSARQTADGGAIVVGNRALERDEDVYLVKFNSSGGREWETSFGGALHDYGLGVVQASDGGYVVACSLGGYWTLLKTGPRGALIWQRTLGTGGLDCTLDRLDDGGFLLAGEGSVGPEKANVVWTDGDGNIVRSRDIGANLYQARKTSGESILATFAGPIYSSTTLRLLDPRGEVIWEKVLRVEGSHGALYGRAVRPASDGGCLVGGDVEYLANKQHRLFLLRTDPNGEVLWGRVYDEFPGFGWSVEERSGGGAVLGGGRSRFSGPLVLGADPSGQLLWRWSPSLPPIRTEFAIRDLEQTTDGGYLVAGGGLTSVYFGLYVAKLAPERGTEGLFIRGDSNGDGAHDISDPVVTLEALFLGGARLGCRDAADANDDGTVDVADPVRSLTLLFLGATALPPPGLLSCCGLDPTPDLTGCDSFPYCGAP